MLLKNLILTLFECKMTKIALHVISYYKVIYSLTKILKSNKTK